MSCPDFSILKRYVYEGLVPLEAPHIETCPLCQISIRKLNEEKKLRGTRPTSQTPYQEGLGSFINKVFHHRYVVFSVTIILIGFLWITAKLMSNGFSLHFRQKPVATVLVKKGDEYQPGQKIQHIGPAQSFKIELKNTDYEYMLVTGVNENGSLRSYYPSHGPQSLPIPLHATLTLPEVFNFGMEENKQIILCLFSKAPLEKSEAENEIRKEFLRLNQKGKDLDDWKGNTDQWTTSWFILTTAASQ